MKKTSLLTLSLISILTCCSNVHNDFFTQIRKANSPSNEIKEQIETKFDYCEIITKYDQYSNEIDYINGIWHYLFYAESHVIFYTKTVINLEKNSDGVIATIYKQVNETIDDSAWVTALEITRNGNNYSYSFDPAEEYRDNAKSVFLDLYNSLFIWNATNLAGVPYYLASNQKDYFIFQEALDYFTKKDKYQVNNEYQGLCSIHIAFDDSIEFVNKGKLVWLAELDMVYSDYRLLSYHTLNFFGKVHEDGEHADVTQLVADLISIDYKKY